MRSCARSIALAYACFALAVGLRAKVDPSELSVATADLEGDVERAWVEFVVRTDVPLIGADGHPHTVLYGEMQMQTVSPMTIENAMLVHTDAQPSSIPGDSSASAFNYAYSVRMPVPVGVVRFFVVDASGARLSESPVEFLVNPAPRQVCPSRRFSRLLQLMNGADVCCLVALASTNRLAGTTRKSDGVHAAGRAVTPVLG
jgi:hypothetical protein